METPASTSTSLFNYTFKVMCYLFSLVLLERDKQSAYLFFALNAAA